MANGHQTFSVLQPKKYDEKCFWGRTPFNGMSTNIYIFFYRFDFIFPFGWGRWQKAEKAWQGLSPSLHCRAPVTTSHYLIYILRNKPTVIVYTEPLQVNINYSATTNNIVILYNVHYMQQTISNYIHRAIQKKHQLFCKRKSHNLDLDNKKGLGCSPEYLLMVWGVMYLKDCFP